MVARGHKHRPVDREPGTPPEIGEQYTIYDSLTMDLGTQSPYSYCSSGTGEKGTTRPIHVQEMMMFLADETTGNFGGSDSKQASDLDSSDAQDDYILTVWAMCPSDIRREMLAFSQQHTSLALVLDRTRVLGMVDAYRSIQRFSTSWPRDLISEIFRETLRLRGIANWIERQLDLQLDAAQYGYL